MKFSTLAAGTLAIAACTHPQARDDSAAPQATGTAQELGKGESLKNVAQRGSDERNAASALRPLEFLDPRSENRSGAAKVLGEIGVAIACGWLQPRIEDILVAIRTRHPKVAAIELGYLARSTAQNTRAFMKRHEEFIRLHPDLKGCSSQALQEINKARGGTMGRSR